MNNIFFINLLSITNRQKLFHHNSRSLPSFVHKSDTDKFIFIMSSKDLHLLPLLAHTINQGFFFQSPSL